MLGPLQSLLFTTWALGAPAIGAAGEVALPSLLRCQMQLQSPDPHQRYHALNELYGIGSPGRPLAPLVLALLHDEERFVRAAAIETLPRLGLDAPSVVPLLVSRLSEPDMRPHVLAALRMLGPAAKSAAPNVLPYLNDPEPVVQSRAAEALAWLGDRDPKTLAALRHAARKGSPFARPRAAWALWDLTRDSQAIVLLASCLEDPRAVVRAEAANILRGIGPEAAAAVPALAAACADPVEFVQLSAMEALGTMGPAARPAVRAIAGNLRADRFEAPPCAAEVIRQLGPLATDALPIMIEVLEDDRDLPYSAELKTDVAWALKRMGPLGKPAVPALARALALASPNRQGDDSLRRAIFDALGNLGPDAAAATQALIQALQQDDASGAAQALGKIGPKAKEAIPYLRTRMRDKDYWRGPTDFAEALWHISRDERALALLLEVAATSDGHAAHVAEKLGNIGPPAKDAVPALIKVLRHPRGDYYRIQAVIALGKIGRAAEPALPALLLASEDVNLRPYVRAAIRQIDPGLPPLSRRWWEAPP